MAFCANCGTEYEGNVCPNCGAAAVPDATQAAPQQPPVQPQGQPQINVNVNNGAPVVDKPPREKLVALLLCIFLGGLGVHNFYTGKIGMGVLYLLTGGLCGIGYIVDIIRIATGNFTDNFGRPLV